MNSYQTIWLQIVPCMAQTEDSKGNSYKQKGWLGVITAGKLWTDFRDCIEDETLIEERTDKLLLEIASKLDVGEWICGITHDFMFINCNNFDIYFNGHKSISTNSQYWCLLVPCWRHLGAPFTPWPLSVPCWCTFAAAFLVLPISPLCHCWRSCRASGALPKGCFQDVRGAPTRRQGSAVLVPMPTITNLIILQWSFIKISFKFNK